MRERGWSRVRLFEEVGAELGYAAKSRSAFLPLLADREPTPAQAAVLTARFGAPDTEKEPGPSEEAGLLVAMTAAINAQAEAFVALRMVILDARVGAIDEREALTDMLRDLRLRLDQGGRTSSGTAVVDPETGR
jgi:hypothetical protein